MDVVEQIKRLNEFIETSYKAELIKRIRKDEKFLVIDFNELAKFDVELADLLLEQPEETIKAVELAIEQLDIENVKGVKARFKNLPESQKIKVSDIRSKHLGSLIVVEGVVRQKSDVRPQVTSARFECPSCGNIINVLQLDSSFKEPSRCGCGRKGKFRLVSKELVDAQGIVLEESPESLEGGEQPKRMNIFLKDDLVSPISEKRTSPGSKIIVVGQIKEVPIILRTGSKSTRFDLMIEANYVEGIEESFYDVKITEEEEKQIKEISESPNVYRRLIDSMAPSIYGYDKIKEALLLQLIGGVRKIRKDGVISRGDMHVLLVGDPGCIAGDSQVALIYKGMEQIQNLGNEHLQPIKEIVTKIRKDGKDKYYDFATVFHYYPQQPVLKVVTETGKEVVCTYNQPFLTKDGWKRADEILLGTKIRVMPKIPSMVKKLAPTGFVRVEKKSGPLKEVFLPDKFTPELASLCGYIIGDGHIHKKGYRITCYINNEEEDIIERLSGFWKKTFNITPSMITKNANGKVKTIDDGSGLLRQIVSTQQLHILEINSRQVAQSLSFLSDKRVPQQIFRSPKSVIARFISWLFEADGCAFGKGRGRTSVQLKSKTAGLLRDVQLLLLYFGIQSRIIWDNLCIRRSHDIELFAKYIGFNSEKKRAKLNHILEEIKNKSETQKRKTPQRYERVVKMIQDGIKDVYDFEIPVSHTFIANGIVCHNSGKSALLKRINLIAPKGRYVSGKGVSGAGITASVVKDEFLRGWSLEAGALVLANNGLCCIDEMDKMSPEDRGAMHEAMEQQCMLPDFKLMLSNGNYVKIGGYIDRIMEQNKDKIIKGKDCEILKAETELISTDFQNSFNAKASKISRHLAPKKFVKIKLTNGRVITVTPEHPCWVIQDGKILTKPAEEMTNKDYFPVPSQIDIQETEYKKENDLLCKILGYHISDGCYELNRGKKNGIQFWNNDKILIEDYKRAIEDFFKINAGITKRKNQFAVRVVSNKVIDFMKNLDESLLEKGIIKKIPDEIMKLPKENIKYLLRSLFDGDGTVVFEKRNGCRISLSAENITLSEQVSDLLLRFGIASSIFQDKNVFKVDISGQDNLSKFLLNVSFLSQKKKNRLKGYCASDKTYRTIRNIIPGCTEKINNIFKELHISAKKEIGHSIDLGVEKQKKFLQKLVLIAEKVAIKKKNSSILKDINELKKLAFGFARWVRIKEVSVIDNKGIKWVYDVTVEPNHTFVSNGMILHNTVSISKANIQATLLARTTVLAAANPKFGRFDPYGIVADQIDLPPTLINRFDLIFTIKDLPDETKDTEMASHILNLHQTPDTKEPDIPSNLLKKYIAYARQNINPQITDGAIEEIKSYYVRMRLSGSSEEGVRTIPISARQLEGLVRLSEASARVRLQNKVTRKDAKKAIELLEYCLMGVGFDKETGKIDIDRIATGISATQRSQIGIVKDIISELESKIGKTIPIDDVVNEAKEKGVSEERVEEILQKLKQTGDIFEPKRGFVQKM